MEEKKMPEWCETEDWCPITVTAELMGRKWHPVIIHRLMQRPMGFNELQREVHKISDKVLSDSLEDLIEKRVVEKEVINQNPKEVRYSLTDQGKSLEKIIQLMFDWGRRNAEKL